MNVEFNRIVIDSREVCNGDIFIPLKGKNYDAHDYIINVIEQKPSAIIVDRIIEIVSDIPIIYTPDNYQSLMRIGLYFRNNFKGNIIAVTGSSGKTMTKELIGQILGIKYKVLKSEGNHNNHIGVPLTLTNLNNNFDIAVLELGMNHKNEISNLSKICKPDIAVITNIGTAHIGNLGSQKDIFKAKYEIIDGMSKGLLVVNGEDKYLSKIRNEKLEIIKCQFDGLFKVINIESDLYKTTFYINYNEKNYKFVLHIPGKHLIMNCLIAIQIGILYGISLSNIKRVIYNYKPLGRRLNLYEYGDIILIDDSYNSNYESVMGILDILEDVQKKKILILGDILELGKYSKKIHRKIGKNLNLTNIDKILLVGQNMYSAHLMVNKGLYFKSTDELNNYLDIMDLDNSVIIVKGSRGMCLDKVVEYLKVKLKK